MTLLVNDYHETFVARQIDDKSAELVLKSVLSCCDLADEFANYPEKTLTDVLADPRSPLACYPCDVIELRRIISEHIIFDLSSVCLFDFEFCKKYFLNKPLLVCLSLESEDCCAIGSMIIAKDNPLFVSDISRIYVRDNLLGGGQMAAIEGVVAEYDSEVEICRLGDVSGIRHPKLSQTVKNRQFVVNIETIGIDNQTVSATSAVNAVAQALTKKWQAISRKTGQKFRPAKFHLEYWLNTPFWSSIVKPKENKVLAQNWYRHTKLGDASSSEDPGASYYEGTPPGQKGLEMTFGPQRAFLPFDVGDKVRLRTGGLGFSQTEGRITDRKGSVIKIRWQTGDKKGKHTVLDMNDTVLLFSTIEKIQ